MAKPPEPSRQQSTSTAEVWAPQGEALQGLYGQGNDWLSQNNQGIQDASQQQQALGQGAINAVAPAWQQQLQGGTLGGYDIAGGLANMVGQNNDVNAQQVGPVSQSHAWDQYNDQVGPGGSLANMEGMYRNQAKSATQDMLGGMDARAAASGMGGGSAHGNAIGRGMEGINSNLQSQMAQTGYDAYNKDLDRRLAIGSENDQFNQQRALSDQQSNLRAQQGNQQFAGQQQQLMSGLLDQQNANASGAIGQQSDIQNFINGPMQGLMNSTQGMQFMQSLLGNPTALTQQQSTTNGATSGGGLGGSFGTSGANLNF